MALRGSRWPSNNSFKPNLLRYTKHMAEKACHVFGSTTQVGLTQALGCSADYLGLSLNSHSEIREGLPTAIPDQEQSTELSAICYKSGAALRTSALGRELAALL